MKKYLSVLLAALMMLSMAACRISPSGNETPDNSIPPTDQSVSTSSVFAGGTGSETDPYQIETIAQLEAFRDSVNDGSQSGYAGAYIQLSADLDLEGTDWTPIGTMEDMEGYSTMFLGTFDGGGHTVSKDSPPPSIPA